MKKKRFTLPVGVLILLLKDNHIFLLKRNNTGWDDGKYCVVGGHIEGNETVTQAAIREASEEARIKIKSQDLQFVNVTHLITNTERIHFAFVVENWEGEPTNNELEKATDAAWFHLDNLPEEINGVSQDVIDSYKNQRFYTEWGWE